MKMKLVMVISVVLLGSLASAFNISVANSSGTVLTMWTHTYGGSSNDWAYSVVETSDGGYAVAGYGAGGANFWLVKTDSFGNMLWNQSYGGGIGFNEAMSVVQTNDGGYAVAGWAGSWVVGPRVYCRLVKTDSSGNMQWNKTYEGASVGGASISEAYSVVQTNDGGYALGGWTTISLDRVIDFWLIKTDSSGNAQWNKTYGGPAWDQAFSMVQTNDGGYALAGTTNSSGAGSYDFLLVKTDSSGNQQWNKTYGGTSIDYAYSVNQTSDGGYAVAGVTGSFGAGGDCWLVKTDSSGNAQWNKTYGGTSIDFAYSVVQTSDGGYALAGFTNSSTGGIDFLLVKTDSSGDAQWSQTYGGTGNEVAQSLIQVSDGGYALAGYTTSFGAGGMDFWLVKTDEFGVVPEFPSFLLLPVLVLFTAVVVVLSKKKLLRKINR